MQQISVQMKASSVMQIYLHKKNGNTLTKCFCEYHEMATYSAPSAPLGITCMYIAVLVCKVVLRSEIGIKSLQMPLYHDSYCGFHNPHLVIKSIYAPLWYLQKPLPMVYL